MKKLALWIVGGLALATACGLAGLHHLSASIVTLTVFCAVPVFIVVASAPLRDDAKDIQGGMIRLTKSRRKANV